jgi:hypothetical protein
MPVSSVYILDYLFHHLTLWSKPLFYIFFQSWDQGLYTGCGKKTSPISNGSYKQIKKDTEKILWFVNNKYDAIW